MRLYYTGASPENIRKAREHAPSHSHAYGWTPQKMTAHDYPYFLDNGAFTGDVDLTEWLVFLQRARKKLPRGPDFVVYPDVYGDADGTWRRYYDLIHEYDHRELRFLFTFTRYYALQPGRPFESQFATALDAGAAGVFVGGPKRWKRAHGPEIVRRAREAGLRTHVGNPSGADGLVWAYRTGFDSCDTTTVFQNGYWHYLDRLERATDETGPADPGPGEQATLAGGDPA